MTEKMQIIKNTIAEIRNLIFENEYITDLILKNYSPYQRQIMDNYLSSNNYIKILKKDDDEIDDWMLSYKQVKQHFKKDYTKNGYNFYKKMMYDTSLEFNGGKSGEYLYYNGDVDMIRRKIKIKMIKDNIRNKKLLQQI